MLRLFSLRSNLALCLVLRILSPILLNHVLFISLHVRALCGVRYIGETNGHFNTRVNEHLFRDKNSHIFKHLSASKGCRDKCDISCFKILDHASTYFQLKLTNKEASTVPCSVVKQR